MLARNKAFLLALLTVLLVAGAGSIVSRAAKDGETAFVDVQAIFDTYIVPVVEDELKPEIAKLQSEFDSKSQGLSNELKQKMFEEYQARLDIKRDELLNANLNKLETLIKQVADELGYSVVFHKDAILVGGKEITSQVVAKWRAQK